MNGNSLTALSNGLVSCQCCHLLCRQSLISDKQMMNCPRCGEPLYHRKPNSISRTWALIIAAIIFYVPANVLPIMTVTSLGHRQSDTILSGVLYFIKTGMWPIAFVIFVASILVPILKLIILSSLLIFLHARSGWRPKDRTRLYFITEVIGRWSMVDIYVIAILVALVQLGALARIAAGPGAVYFACVVIITMLAAMSFDPRLIWDQMEEGHDQQQFTE